ncbi:MAG: 4-hydroxythreonine-4-phosphate dehydrogenase PdxA [Pseudomonadota bacterium]
MKPSLPIIGITMGDPVGIGPEIIVSALADPGLFNQCRPLVIGDATVMKKAMDLKQSRMVLNQAASPETGIYSHGIMDLYPTSDLKDLPLTPGIPTPETGRAMLSYITTAVDLALEGRISGMATCPITKTAMKMAGSPFHGHTELIAHRTGTADFSMMLAGDRLKVVLVTIHIPVSQVSRSLSVEAVLKTIRITGISLQKRFGILRPRIAVAGLNPHAGESSMFGTEEETIIRPAMELASREGFDVSGPYPPDTLFFHAAKGTWDAVVCMYHDQGLIPFKMIHFSDGVNTTLGLPIIRTSVDHGTAYDIAWQGIADHSSLVQAIRMAALQASSSIN